MSGINFHPKARFIDERPCGKPVVPAGDCATALTQQEQRCPCVTIPKMRPRDFEDLVEIPGLRGRKHLIMLSPSPLQDQAGASANGAEGACRDRAATKVAPSLLFLGLTGITVAPSWA